MEAAGPAQSDPLGESLERVGRSPMLTIGAGALSIVIAVLVLVPANTAVVIAWLFAIQMIVTGVLQLVAAFAGDAGPGGRVLLGLLGAHHVGAHRRARRVDAALHRHRRRAVPGNAPGPTRGAGSAHRRNVGCRGCHRHFPRDQRWPRR